MAAITASRPFPQWYSGNGVPVYESAMPTPPSEWRPTHFAYHAVAHIDLLGQTEALERLDAVPLPCTEEQLLPALRATAVPVVELRKFFVNYFKTTSGPTDVLGTLPPDQREAAERLRIQDVVLRSWSDTTVVTVPLRNVDNPLIPRLADAYRTMIATAGTTLCFLAGGPRLLLRGGIDVGKAIDLPVILGMPDTNEIYGAVIGRAYVLEAKIAQYPRVVVGDTLLKMLESVELHASDADAAWQYAARMARPCRELLILDPLDGRPMLDFLGPEVRRMAGVTLDQLRAARDFIKSTHERFIRERNDTLAARYGRLLDYCQSSVSSAEGEVNVSSS